ncbi:MAG: hypothetical protein WBH01_05825 [Dehalococcoidia bacterium]
MERIVSRHLNEIQAVLALMLVISALVLPLPQPAVAQSLDTSASWPMFRQNSRHTGLSPYDTGDNPGTQKWTFTTGHYVDSSPAIGSDGAIHVRSRYVLSLELSAANRGNIGERSGVRSGEQK